MKATITLSINIGDSLKPDFIIEELKQLITDQINDAGYYTPDEIPGAGRQDGVVQVTRIDSTLYGNTQ